MNERILELIGPAQKEVWGNNPYNGSPEFEGYELDVEKFAELIVRECIDIVPWIMRKRLKNILELKNESSLF